MNALSEITQILKDLSIPAETGVFSSKAPDTYAVLVPLNDSFPLSADDWPQADEQSVRVSLFTRGNYTKQKNSITRSLLSAGCTVTDRRYNGFEAGSGYHQLTIDVAKAYEFEEE